MKERAKMIEQKRSELVSLVRNYVTKQESAWQQIPLLALHADGRDAWDRKLQWAYHYGYWAVNDTGIYVDLEHGELLTYSIYSNLVEPCRASDEQTLQLSSALDLLDAQQIIQKLVEKVQEPYSTFFAREREQQKEVLRAELQLSATYMRRSPFPKDESPVGINPGVWSAARRAG